MKDILKNGWLWGMVAFIVVALGTIPFIIDGDRIVMPIVAVAAIVLAIVMFINRKK